ncbi:MAG: phosphomannomutase/phosphoglucomutase [Heliobacteriaceae bacterium]|jgi:phosphomannomutase/phosphoglucomutase|nr:phosphomannomutase/phosphoglucomutase [Heliobacteriaceae bacterium]
MNKYKHAFGKNDIRGIYGEDITEELFYRTGRAFVKWLQKQSGKPPGEMYITVTTDARTHSPSLRDALNKGIASTGANVVNLGLAPTPVGYYSEAAGLPKELTGGKDVIAALIITASHNPKEYNGLKMTYGKMTLNELQIKEVYEEVKNLKIEESPGGFGKIKEFDILPDYLREMKSQFGHTGKGIKVVVDSANATGGVIGPEIYKEIGCEVVELFSEPDGTFPNHHPNPSDVKTLDTLKKTVVKEKADLGIAFDGDSDRIGVVDSAGNYITGDKLLLIYALDLIEQGLKPVVVSEVKCSQVLYDTVNRLGGNAVMCKTGHGYIKSRMKETNAVLAGEMSGHTFFKDRYYGFDDAIYAGCRIIEIIAKHKKINPDFKIQDMLKPFSEVYSSDEVRFPCPNDKKKSVLEKVKAQIENDRKIFGSPISEIITLDGMRIIFNGGFALIRQSNTEPVFTLRFEARTKDECERFQKIMLGMLEKAVRQAG